MRHQASHRAGDEIICHRMGYCGISPQRCLEKHVKEPDTCGACRWFIVAAESMAEATDTSPLEILHIVKQGGICRHPNPVITPSSKPLAPIEEKTVNSRIVYINGLRMPQGKLLDFRQSGGLAERSLVAMFSKEFVEATKSGIQDVSIDEYMNGRLQIRYEWNSEDKTTFGGPVTSKVMRGGVEHDAVGFRCFPVTTDAFSR